jgi:hypothetical protein
MLRISRVAEQLLAPEGNGISVELATEVMKVHSSLPSNALDPLFLSVRGLVTTLSKKPTYLSAYTPLNIYHSEKCFEQKQEGKMKHFLCPMHIFPRATRLRSWLRHYARSRKVAGSIPDDVIGFFN